MLSHFLVSFTLTALSLFPGVSAAAIGSLRDLDSRHVSTLIQRDNDPQQDENYNLPREVEDVLPSATQDQLTRLMSEVPDEVVDQGTDATENWLREHLPSLSIATRDSDADNAELEQRDWFYNFIEAPAILRCSIGLLWAVRSKIDKVGELKEAIDDVGGYRKAAKIILDGKRSGSAKGRKIEDLLSEILSNKWVKKNCSKGS